MVIKFDNYDMDKRYQVFVSSTYEDLREERQEVMHALLELDCIPSGMELFPAADEDQWSVIKKVIDDCDYYIIISAGRYGSISPSGVSYTEMEFRYAVEKKKPIVVFLHKDMTSLPARLIESTDEGKKRLSDFREVLQKRMCKYWNGSAELGSVVSRSLVRLIKSTPAVGWVRSDAIADGLAAGEILRLRRQLEEVEQRLIEARLTAPPGTEHLSQGGDTFEAALSFEATSPEGETWTWDEYPIEMTWDDILYDVGPTLLSPTSETEIHDVLNQAFGSRVPQALATDPDSKDHKDHRRFNVSQHDFETMLIQLRALGIIAKAEQTASKAGKSTLWILTPYGDQLVTQLRAVLRKNDVPEI